MNKLGRIASAPYRGVKRLTGIVFRRAPWRIWSATHTALDYARAVGTGDASSSVMAPLQWIQRTFPEAPPAIWELVDSGEEEQLVDHDLIRLLARPNPYYAGTALWMATVLDWNLSGNSYWFKIRNAFGKVVELWWCPSIMIKPKGDEKTFITHYEYNPNGTAQRIEIEDVVHFRYGLDVDDPRQGRSPLYSVLREVFTDDEAANFTAALLKNMGVPGLVVSPKGDIAPGEDDVKAVKSYIHEAFGGGKRGEPLVMSGPTEVEQFGFNPQQMDLKTIRRIPEERVSAVLGVPAIVAGLGAGLDRSTFANYAEAREAGYEDCLIPSQRILAEEVRFQLLPDFESDPMHFRFGFDLSKVRVLQDDRNKLAERFNVGVAGGWIKVAEARRAMDLEVDDNDEIYLRPINLIETDGTPQPELPPQPALPPGSEPPAQLPPGPAATESSFIDMLRKNVEHPGQPYDEAAIESLLELAGVKHGNRLQRSLIRQLHRDFVHLGAVMSSRIASVLDELGRKTEEAFVSLVGPEIVLPLAAARSSNGHVKIESDEHLTDRVMGAIRFEETRVGIRDEFAIHTRRVIGATVSTINRTLGDGTALTPSVVERLVQAGARRGELLDIRPETRSAIMQAIDEGRASGLNPRETARLIRSYVPAGRFRSAGPKYRAELIARTETLHAQRAASIATYREATSVSACVAFDGTDDEECAARDGQTFTFDEAEVEMEQEHPNGTLAFAPVIG